MCLQDGTLLLKHKSSSQISKFPFLASKPWEKYVWNEMGREMVSLGCQYPAQVTSSFRHVSIPCIANSHLVTRCQVTFQRKDMMQEKRFYRLKGLSVTKLGSSLHPNQNIRVVEGNMTEQRKGGSISNLKTCFDATGFQCHRFPAIFYRYLQDRTESLRQCWLREVGKKSNTPLPKPQESSLESHL